MSRSIRLILGFFLGSLAMPIVAQTLSLQTLSSDPNFRLAGTFGFSVAYVPGEYRLFATAFFPRMKWQSGSLADAYNTTDCPYLTDPTTWTVPGCIDSIGVFTKPEGSSNGLWNAYPGISNINSLPSQTMAPIWPGDPAGPNGYGVQGFSPRIGRHTLDAMPIVPTGADALCHTLQGTQINYRYTAASNGKVFQVYYNGGVFRWYMAFNGNIHQSSGAGSENPYNGNDTWRILWASSSDGMNWTPDTNILFRSINESQQCGAGLLVEDFFLDDGQFCLVFAEVGTNNVYLARSYVNPDPGATIGYTSWYIWSKNAQSGQYAWRPTAIGQLNLTASDASGFVPEPVMPNRNGWGIGVKQAAITRVYTSTVPGSPSRYVGITSDAEPAQPGLPLQRLQLWSTSSLDQPFAYEGEVPPPVPVPMGVGIYGWEFGFTKYSDNLPASPRVASGGFDFWFVQNENAGTALSGLTVSRAKVMLTGGIFSPTITSLTASPSLPQYAGTTITWAAAATGGTAPLQYAFYLYTGASSSWSLARSYSTSNSWAWTPSQAGQYEIQVWVRSNGSVAAYDAWAGSGSFNISTSSPPPTITSLTASPSLPRSAGTMITWAATATGGAAPLQYAFYLYTAASSSWSLARSYSTSNSWAWTPSQSGQYEIQVWVKNNGSIAAYDAWAGSGNVTISP